MENFGKFGIDKLNSCLPTNGKKRWHEVSDDMENQAAQSRYKAAFTLAEMMVVMLIASIILACMAPIMTTKMKADQSIQTSPWRWAKDNVNAYYSASSNQAAMIGQNTRGDADNAKLIINNATDLDDMILFKKGASTLAHLQVVGATDGIKLLLGTLASGVTQSDDTVAIGRNVTPSGKHSVVLGGDAKATASNGVAIGHSASAMGSNVIAIGNTAGSTHLTSTNTNGIAIGTGSLRNNISGSYNIAIGSFALNTNTTGARNIATGATALYKNTTGSDNIAAGLRTLYENTTGSANIALGSLALSKNTTGANNTATGYYALKNNTTGKQNTAVGSNALLTNTTGENNTATGFNSLNFNTTGGNNAALGYQSLYSNTTGAANTAIGVNALYSNQTGENNTAIGVNACQNVKGSNKTCIGAYSGPTTSDTSTNNVIYLGTAGSTVYIAGDLIVGRQSYLGYNLDKTPNGSYNYYNNQSALFVNVGLNSNTSMPYHGPVLQTTNNDAHLKVSDRRLKNVGNENLDGLAKLRQLKIYNYTFKKDKDKIPQVGVMAQDLQKIFPHAVSKGTDSFLRIRLEDMFYAVINAIKELDTRVTRLEKENKLLKEQNKALELRLQALEKKIK